MELTNETCNLVSTLEYLIGKQCYNGNSYNGWTGEYGCSFRYPVYSKMKNGDKYTEYRCKGIANVTKDNAHSLVYKFGSNHLSIGSGIIDMLNFLSNRYGLDFNELENTYQKKVTR